MVKATSSLLALTFISIQMAETGKAMPAETLRRKSRRGKHKSFLFTLKGLCEQSRNGTFQFVSIQKERFEQVLLPKCSQIFFPLQLFVF